MPLFKSFREGFFSETRRYKVSPFTLAYARIEGCVGVYENPTAECMVRALRGFVASGHRLLQLSFRRISPV